MVKLKDRVEVVFKGDSNCEHIFLGDSVQEAMSEGDYLIEIKERKCVKCGRIELLKIFNSLNKITNR